MTILPSTQPTGPSFEQIVSLEEAAAFLNLPAVPGNPTKLKTIILGCASRLEQEAGTIIFEEITEVHDGGDVSIFVRRPPIIDVVRITEVIGIVPWSLSLQPVGEPVDNFGFSIDDYTHGRITRRSAGSQQFPFYANTGNITVTYTSGVVESLPYNVKMALLEFVKHVYQTSTQGSAFGAHEEDEDQTFSPSAYAMPYKVYEWLGTDRRLPIIG